MTSHDALNLNLLLEKLTNAPQRIRDATEGATARQLNTPLTSDQWSIAQIFAHTRASDDVLSYRCYLILAHDHPYYHDLDERHWEEVVRYDEMDFNESLQTFAVRRAELMRLLRRASPQDWARAGMHSQRGEQTLWTVASYLQEHEDEHITQLRSLMKQIKLLLAIAGGLRLKDHRDIEGRKAYILHQPDDSGDAVDATDIEALVELGLISSNKKFPAAMYWLTEEGERLIR